MPVGFETCYQFYSSTNLSNLSAVCLSTSTRIYIYILQRFQLVNEITFTAQPKYSYCAVRQISVNVTANSSNGGWAGRGGVQWRGVGADQLKIQVKNTFIQRRIGPISETFIYTKSRL